MFGVKLVLRFGEGSEGNAPSTWQASIKNLSNAIIRWTRQLYLVAYMGHNEACLLLQPKREEKTGKNPYLS